jgi:hypothetical protein
VGARARARVCVCVCVRVCVCVCVCVCVGTCGLALWEAGQEGNCENCLRPTQHQRALQTQPTNLRHGASRQVVRDSRRHTPAQVKSAGAGGVITLTSSVESTCLALRGHKAVDQRVVRTALWVLLATLGSMEPLVACKYHSRCGEMTRCRMCGFPLVATRRCTHPHLPTVHGVGRARVVTLGMATRVSKRTPLPTSTFPPLGADCESCWR